MLVVLFVLINLICLLVKGELYFSARRDGSSSGYAKVLIHTLDGYIETTEKKTSKIKRMIWSIFKMAQGEIFQDFVSNPINAFVLIKKLTVDWDDARIIMSCVPMTAADDCLEMGRQAFQAGFYDSAISWLDLTQKETFPKRLGYQK
ncbi:prolyl 4-hydroxylase subunit alpha-2 [Caerostris extrusa]|uniref:Prolyl 4-hydroxylase subunit alpha-2 n=1 Tax=Caerostris extrusa TaxID=172846 RepID=A0AAV4QIT6_CAEEX|nr:prolyl 4-hydroxylase subunit alpha-2 [Caerostris extrusa]